MGGINRHMPPFNRQELHCVCLNHPFGIETVQGVEDNTQVSHDTAGGEGEENRGRTWVAMKGSMPFGVV